MQLHGAKEKLQAQMSTHITWNLEVNLLLQVIQHERSSELKIAALIQPTLCTLYRLAICVTVMGLVDLVFVKQSNSILIHSGCHKCGKNMLFGP